MIKKILGMFILLMVFCCGTSFAGNFTMATGGEKGVYHKIGSFFLPKQLDGKMDIQCVNTQGSVENVQLLREGKVQGAMLQMDALIMNPDIVSECIEQINN